MEVVKKVMIDDRRRMTMVRVVCMVTIVSSRSGEDGDELKRERRKLVWTERMLERIVKVKFVDEKEADEW